MFTTHALDWCDEELGGWLYRKTRKASNIGGFVPDCCRLHEPGFRIDYGASQELRFVVVADVRAQLRKFLQRQVIDFIVDHRSLLGGADGSVVEGLRQDDVGHSCFEVRS